MGQFFDNTTTVILLICITAAALLLLLLLVFIRISRLKKKLDEAYEENHAVTAEYHRLKSLYQEAADSYKKLSAQYDELYKSKESIKKIAYTDPLTELPNRIAFMEMLDNIMLTLRSDEIIGIMDIDLDNFKNINDTLGHSYGDELLIDVTHRLKQVMDENDCLARIGGDEFVILTQNLCDTASFEEKIKKVRNVFTFPFELLSKEYFISVSIGVAFAPKDGKSAQTIVKNVDTAMYVAKANGKNTYAYYDASLNQKLTDKIELQSELRKAIEKNEFVLLYQAQMDLMNKKVLGFEALIRWNHPTKGMLYPSDFIYLAEESGLIVPIGKWALETACLQLKEWTDMGYENISMAVNLSARQFKDKDFVQMVLEVIEKTGADPSKLELEITESIALEDLDYTISTIEQLKAIGVRFSLDDFGTGYSSMSYLKKLPVSNLKIDKSFLDTVMDDVCDQKIIQAIITLARNLDLNIIAEGVERTEQEQFLQESNCNMAQGFLYSKPLPREMAAEYLKSVNRREM